MSRARAPVILVLEGISGSGKSTQTYLLAERLSPKQRLVTIGEFSESATGQLLRAAYHLESSRFVRLHDGPRYADQTHFVLLADLFAKVSRMESANADVVLVDRFCDSWLCYTLAAPDRTVLRGDDVVRRLHAAFRAEFLRANVRTVYLNISAREAALRLALRDGRTDTHTEVQRLGRIADLYDQLYAAESAIVIDATQPEDAVTEAIITAMTAGASRLPHHR